MHYKSEPSLFSVVVIIKQQYINDISQVLLCHNPNPARFPNLVRISRLRHEQLPQQNWPQY